MPRVAGHDAPAAPVVPNGPWQPAVEPLDDPLEPVELDEALLVPDPLELDDADGAPAPPELALLDALGPPLESEPVAVTAPGASGAMAGSTMSSQPPRASATATSIGK